MASIFASSDIAALVAGFPPPQPTRNQPSLIRSLSGKALFNSRKVSDQFQRFLDSREDGNRIKLKDLPSLLRVKSTESLLNYHYGPIRFSQDKQSIIRSPDFEDIMENLQSKSTRAFVDLSSFAYQNDVALECIDEETLGRYALGLFPGASFSSSTHIGTRGYVEQVKQNIESLIKAPVTRPIDLTRHLPDVPAPVLRFFAAEIIGSIDGLDGALENQSGRIVFVPAAQQEEQERITYTSIIEEKVQHLMTERFSLFSIDENTDQLREDVIRHYQSIHGDQDLDLMNLKTTDGRSVVVTNGALQEILKESQATFISTVKADRARGSRTAFLSDRVGLESRSKRPRLVSLLLQSQYRETLDAALASAIEELDNELRHRFKQLFQVTVMAPLHLYAAACIGDTTLKQNQEVFIGGHFCREVIPQFAETARREDLVRKGPFSGDRARMRDTEALEETCNPTQHKTLTEVQGAVMKLARKQNIPEPNTERIDMVKRETLEQRGRAIFKMNRGSDVLQNLIWMLFARRSEGLFLSSGRDTSRMIEQYKLFNDFEIWENLVSWRNLLKAEKAGLEEIEAMKQLAIKVLKDMNIPVAVDDASDLIA